MKLNISRVKPFPIAGLGLAVAILTGSIQSQGQSATQEKEAAPAPYSVIDLGVVGGPPGGPYVINNYGLVSGAAATQDGRMHAVLWFEGQKLDIGTPGLGGPNSAAFGVNRFAQTGRDFGYEWGRLLRLQLLWVCLIHCMSPFLVARRSDDQARDAGGR
jgi:hypothetical protein